MANEIKHAIGGRDPGVGYVDVLSVGDGQRATLGATSRRGIDWIGESTDVRDIVFWLRPSGRVLGLDGRAYLPRFAEQLRTASAELTRQINAVVFLGGFKDDNKIVIPRPVIAYLLGGPVSGNVWVCSRGSYFELWGPRFVDLRVGDASERLDELIELPEGAQ